MHPSLLTDQLRAHFPSLVQIKPPLVHAYAELMLRLSTHCGRRHRRAGREGIPSNALSIHCRKLRDLFGVDGFREINNQLGCIASCGRWDMKNGETKAYWITEGGKQMIELTRTEAIKGKENLLLSGKGNKIRSRNNGVHTARDTRGNNAVTDAELGWAIPVNLDAISMVLEIGVGQFFPEADADRIAITDCTLRAIHACALNDNVGRGLIPQVYKEAPSGRLYGTGELSLQNVTREAKRVAFLGAHEYDFVNCHYRLLFDFAVEESIEVSAIRDYLVNPKTFRYALADELGITYEQAKKCLLAILYGATKGYWADCAIPALIGVEKAEQFYALPQYEDLMFEVVEIGEHMRNRAPRRTGAIVNCRGKAIAGNPRQELAHILQGLESLLLHVIIKEYAEDILIIQHDGFTTSTYIDPSEIETQISDQTGIDMPVSYEQLALSKKL